MKLFSVKREGKTVVLIGDFVVGAPSLLLKPDDLAQEKDKVWLECFIEMKKKMHENMEPHSAEVHSLHQSTAKGKPLCSARAVYQTQEGSTDRHDN